MFSCFSYMSGVEFSQFIYLHVTTYIDGMAFKANFLLQDNKILPYLILS